MNRRYRKANLFEAMSRAPQTESLTGRRRASPWRRAARSGPPAPVVAEPLTEEEAAQELSAMRAEQERVERERQEREAARLAAREAQKAARLARKADRQERRRAAREARLAAAGTSTASPVRASGGRLTVSLDAIGWGVAIVTVAGIAFGAFLYGRRAGGGPGPTTAAALARQDGSGSPLLPDAGTSGPRKKGAPHDPDLRALIRSPSASPPAVTTNAPPKVVPNGADQTEAADERLNYLQIEWFPFTRQQDSDQVAAELNHAMGFLARNGVRTRTRRLSNGFLLFSQEGFLPGREQATEREAFRKRIAALGQEYRRIGGRYEFKGCFYVGRTQAQAGRPM